MKMAPTTSAPVDPADTSASPRAGVFLHRDESLGVLDVHAGEVDVILFCAGADLLLVSAKQNVTTEFDLRRDRTLQDLQGRIVAAERINDDSHK